MSRASQNSRHHALSTTSSLSSSKRCVLHLESLYQSPRKKEEMMGSLLLIKCSFSLRFPHFSQSLVLPVYR